MLLPGTKVNCRSPELLFFFPHLLGYGKYIAAGIYTKGQYCIQ